MNARDALARIAEEAHADWCIENPARIPWHADAWKYIAAAILAAGYATNDPQRPPDAP